MFEWLNDKMHAGQVHTDGDVFLRIIAAMVLGCVVAFIHHFTHPKDSQGTNGFLPTIVLLTILLAMVVLAVGDNIARSFTLAGVLAIVRFRTVVKNTRDSAFVICAVVVGMAAGTGYLAVAIIGLPVVAIAAYFTQDQHATKPLARISNLELRYALTHNPQQSADGILNRLTDSHSVCKTGICKKGTAIKVCYRCRLKRGVQAPDLVRELLALEGMQSVEWKV